MSVLVCGRACLSGMFAAFRRGPDIHASAELQKHLCFQKDKTQPSSEPIICRQSPVRLETSHTAPQTSSSVCRRSHPPSQQVIHLPAVTGTQDLSIRTLAWARVWLPAALTSASACQMWGQRETRATLTRLFLMNSGAGGGVPGGTSTTPPLTFKITGTPQKRQQHHYSSDPSVQPGCVISSPDPSKKNMKQIPGGCVSLCGAHRPFKTAPPSRL